MIENLTQALRQWLMQAGLSGYLATLVVETVEIIGVALVAIAANKITKSVILHFAHRLAKRTKNDWDDVLVERKLFHRLAQLAPALVIHSLASVVFTEEKLVALAEGGAEIYMLVVALLVVDAALASLNDIYQKFEVSTRIPILGYLQVVQIVVTVAVLLVAVSIVIDQSPWTLLGGLGAATAIILLIFKDTILGLVAGIQLVANDMVRLGDWIEMPKYGADGDVVEITLNTVKVRNWDKTITTIPTCSLISDSFKNWRGMSESGGRRIKRSLNIDVGSIKFCTTEMIEKFSKIQILKKYIQSKLDELNTHNREQGIDESVLVNGRRITNIGTFRAYLVAYLQAHPQIRQDMTFLVRQLQPTEKGLPLEVYVFSADQVWANYEDIQADIFDHIYAALPQFDLRPFQNPTGQDIRDTVAAGRSA
jgi:miniconductance mechanosensitive channel